MIVDVLRFKSTYHGPQSDVKRRRYVDLKLARNSGKTEARRVDRLDFRERIDLVLEIENVGEKYMLYFNEY